VLAALDILLIATNSAIYDYLLTLHIEIELIWFARWTYTKTLFLIMRYTALVGSLILLHNQLFPDVSVEMCKTMYPMGAYMVLVVIFLAQVMIAIRTWAVWRRSRILGVGLGALLLGILIFSCIRTSKFFTTVEYAPPLYPGYRGCFITKASGEILWPDYVYTTVVEATVLILMAVSAFRSYRNGKSSELSHVVHRDGIMFYVFLLCITATSMTMKIVATSDMKFMIDPLMNAMYPVLVARIVFNIRTVGSSGQLIELHTGYHESLAVAMPLQVMFVGDRTESTDYDILAQP